MGWRCLPVVLVLALAGCTAGPPAEPDPTQTASPPTLRPTSAPPPTVPATAEPPATAAPADPTSLLMVNGNILTMAHGSPAAEAVLIAGDRLVALGDSTELQAIDPSAAVVDLAGATVLPGFIDSHTHRVTQRFKWGFETVGEAVDEALAQGWTGLDELAVSPEELEALIEADRIGELRLRLNAYPTANGFAGEELGEWYSAYRPGQELSPHLRIAGLKVFIDHDSGRTLLWDQPGLDAFVRSRQLEGWQVSMKAIGRQSHELALNALEYALDGASNAAQRHRLEHSLAVSDEQLRRMAELGIIAAIQPSFPGVVWYEEDIRRLAEEEGRPNMFRWPEYLAAGVISAASPYNPDPRYEELTDRSHVSPMGLLYRSLTQVGLGDSPAEAWMLERALSVEELLPMMTIIGAYADGTDELRGSLEAGKLADLVVLSRDPRTVAPEELLEIEVLLTMVGGIVEWCAPGAGDLCSPGAGPVAPGPVESGPEVSASGSLAGHEPGAALDGSLETYWNAGDHPEQWLQLTLAEVGTVSRLALTVSQYPAGETTHEVWGGADEGSLRLLHTFEGWTSDGDVLRVEPEDAWTGIGVLRVVTRQSPSWVAWYELALD